MLLGHKQFKSEVTSVSVSPSQKLIAVGGRSFLKLFSLPDEINIDAHSNNDTENRDWLQFDTDLSNRYISDLAMNPTMENVLISGSARKYVEMWDLVTFSNRTLCTLDRAVVSRLSWQVSDPNTFLIGATDGKLRVVDVRSQDPIHTTINPRSREIRDCQFNPHDNCTLAACFDNGTVQIYDCRQPRVCARRMNVHDGGAICLSYHPTRRGIIATGGSTNVGYKTGPSYKLRVIAPDRDTYNLRSIRVPGVTSLCWRNSSEIATGLDSKFDHDVLLWNYEIPYQSPIARFPGHTNQVSRVTYIHNKPNNEDDMLLSVGKDGKVILQRHRTMFLPKRGRAFGWSHIDFVTSNESVRPDSPNRGQSSAKVFSNVSDPIYELSETYRISGLPSLNAYCEVNSKAARKAGNHHAAGFWTTLSALFESIAEKGPAIQVAPIPSPSPPFGMVTSPKPGKDEESIVSSVSSSSTKRNILRELRLVDPSVSMIFDIRTKLPAFRQTASDIHALVSNSRKNPMDPNVDEPHLCLVPVSGCEPEEEISHDKMLKDIIVACQKSLDVLVDQVGDVQTAVVCVLVFFELQLPLPTTLTNFKRWVWALCDLLERKSLFSRALQFSREGARLVKQKDEELPETRVGMGCGSCGHPLPSLGIKGECLECSSVVARCVICRRISHGMYACCLKCGHGGHLEHMQEWFKDNTYCASGCDCECSILC